jgi:amidohydrolase
MSDTTLVEAAAAQMEEAVALRRRIHRQPELGLENPRTQEAVLEALDGLGMDVTTGTATTSVVAVLDGGRPGPTLLLRADMDGLPMHEDTGLDYASTVDDAMHACGHDAHVAMLVGAARVLHDRRDELAGRVAFAFQPGEEGHHGARVMLEEGCSRGDDAPFGRLRHPHHARRSPPVDRHPPRARSWRRQTCCGSRCVAGAGTRPCPTRRSTRSPSPARSSARSRRW